MAETRGGFNCGIGLLTLEFDFRGLALEATAFPLDEPLIFVALIFVDFGLALVSASAFRLNRRCTLVIAATNSSFRMPCQPETP